VTATGQEPEQSARLLWVTGRRLLSRARQHRTGWPAVADRERILGPGHPDTLTTRNNLAIAYQDAGRLDEAESLRKRAEPSGL